MECENLAGKWKITIGSSLYEELWPEYPIMSEVRWSGFGEMTTQDVATFLCSGRPEGENVSCEGVGMLLDKEEKKSSFE